MTVDECKAFKQSVQTQLVREGIRVYDFPLSAIPNSTGADARTTEVKRLRQRQPFAVCTSSTVVTKEDGSKVKNLSNGRNTLTCWVVVM